ncbi:MAG: replicative DNA helicase [Anaerohalosphaeraceae bacterium]|nr:replicative DNA helicase [Anaerohalosphaeraceae bacterium]
MNQSNRQTNNKTSGQCRTGTAAMGDGVLSGRSMPESLEAEAAVLGSMVIDPDCIGQVVQQLTSEAFYRSENQMVFNAVVALWEKIKTSEDFDLVLLRDELKKRNQIDDVGGADYLVRIAESVPSSANIDQYVRIVKEKHMMRDLISAAGEVLSEAFDPSGDAGDKLDRAEQKIFNVTQQKVTGSAVSIKSLLAQAFEAIDKREGHHVTGLATGFAELDEMTCGLQNGEMIIVAGRPSMGKTSLAMNIAEYIGADDDKPVAVFSLEMSKQQLAERMLCSRGMIDSQLVRKGLLSDSQYQELVHVAGEMSEKPIYIDDTPGITPLELRGKARRLKSQYGIQCIFIDYLQLMSLGGRIESRQQEVSEMSRYLKALARELEVPVVVLSQLNRGAENREDHRPRMSDLRESGSIEQDADVIMLLHREDYYRRNEEGFEPNNVAEIIIAKQRNGPTGTVELNFDGRYTRFGNSTRVQEPF